jgi:hypothetical protein
MASLRRNDQSRVAAQARARTAPRAAYLPRFDSSRRRSTVSVDVTGKTASNRFQNVLAGATPRCRVTTSFMRAAARRTVQPFHTRLLEDPRRIGAGIVEVHPSIRRIPVEGCLRRLCARACRLGSKQGDAHDDDRDGPQSPISISVSARIARRDGLSGRVAAINIERRGTTCPSYRARSEPDAPCRPHTIPVLDHRPQYVVI